MFKGRAPSRQHNSFGPTSLSCALSSSVSDYEKGRLEGQILLLSTFPTLLLFGQLLWSDKLSGHPLRIGRFDQALTEPIVDRTLSVVWPAVISGFQLHVLSAFFSLTVLIISRSDNPLDVTYTSRKLVQGTCLLELAVILGPVL